MRTSMSLEDLHDLSCLQIPNVGFMVFTSSYYPLATCNTEASGNTIFSVYMPLVYFQAASCLIVPQTNGTVMCCGEDVF